MAISAYRKKILLGIFAIIIGVLVVCAARADSRLMAEYNRRHSSVLLDRSGNVIRVEPNYLGYYAIYKDAPLRFKELLLAAEDKYFYYHPGVNPASAVRALWRRARGSGSPASSTITQQFVKMLLKQENTRTLKNKIVELGFAASLELFRSKEEILTMYINSLYFGNQTQGLFSAAQLYFEKPLEVLEEEEILALVATIPEPSNEHPFLSRHAAVTAELAQRLGSSVIIPTSTLNIVEVQTSKAAFRKAMNSPTSFELAGLIAPPSQGGSRGVLAAADQSDDNVVRLTTDAALTEKIRGIIFRRLQGLAEKNVTNGAVVVIKLPENELVAMVGSPNPESTVNGHQINMAAQPRPIGSTIKPLIYVKAFEKGLRPYSLVDDKEYRYEAAGFSFYPKNFDRTYRGRVTLHYALANSLNVPTVKVLEYIGLSNFYDFLLKDLAFKPIQPLKQYELGIALGGLEMDLLQLARYLTIFPNGGVLLPLKVAVEPAPPSSSQKLKIVDAEYTQLINKILSDRATGVDQFGLASSLNLPWKNYAVKTGTSRDFHDSWTVGYTPDFLVGVWVGNSDNTPMDSVTGVNGAAQIWHEVMGVIYNSPYNKNTPFDFNKIKEFSGKGGSAYGGNMVGLPGDDVSARATALLEQSLIITPHQGDVFLLEPHTKIPLRASTEVQWQVNGKELSKSKETIFSPALPGAYTVTARSSAGAEENVVIRVNKGI